MVIFKLLLSLTTLLLVGFNFLYRYRHKDHIKNSIYKEKGINCYNCSEYLPLDDSEFLNILQNDEKNLTLCKSCKRDLHLSKIIGFYSAIPIHMKRYILSTNRNYMVILPIFALFLLAISLIINNPIMSNYASIINSTSLIFFWGLEIYRIYINRK